MAKDLDALIDKEFDNVYNLAKTDTSVTTYYDSGVYALNYICSKNIYGAYPKGRIIGIDGLSGCMHENTIIKINRGKRTGYREYTIKDLYQRFHNKAVYGGRQWDKKIPTKTFSYDKEKDAIVFNEIEDVIYSGVKKTYKIETESGKIVIATPEHPFKVPDENIKDRGNPEKDNFVPLEKLEIGDEVFIKSESNKKVSFGGRSKGRREVYGIQFHPYAWSKKVDKYEYKRMHLARLLVEANMNKLNIGEYINILKYDKKKASTLKFLSPDKIVHHKDGNHLNDVLENLEVLSKEEHDGYHANLKGFRGFGHNEWHLEKIIKIEEFGESETYDIRMKEPHSNFVANDFIVHNTGKSLLAATAMRDPKIDTVVIVESEGGGHSQELLEFAGVDKNKVRILKASTLVSYKMNKKTGEVEEIGDKDIPKTKDTDKYLYVEGAGYLIRKLANLIQFNKMDKNILIILDSLGNMQSIRGLGGGFDMGKRGQDMTNFFKNFDNEFERSGLTFIFTNKLYQSLNPTGPSYVATGGESPIYNSSLYLRLSETVDSDDITEGDKKEEKERRQTSLGSSIKTIKAKVIKSRFGTEFRNVPFLLDFAVGPVRMSGLFRLLKDFGVIVNTGGAWYSAPGIIEKKFYKKDFVDIVLKDEENLIAKFQERLEEREKEIKEKRKNIQASDEEELQTEEVGEADNSNVDEQSSNLDDMKSQMIKDKENQ